MRKPNPLIYQLVLKKLQVEPSAAVFLDDLGENLKAAKALGITTIKVFGVSKKIFWVKKMCWFNLQSV